MKKTIIFILTVITVISAFALPVFAEGEVSNGVFESFSASEIEKTESDVDASVDSIPTIGATEPSEDVSVDESSDAEAKEDDDMNVEIKVSTDNMSTTLKHMGIGMLGVMLVLALIAIVVLILNKIFK